MQQDFELRGRRAEAASFGGEPVTRAATPLAEAAERTRLAYAGKLFPGQQIELFRDTSWAFATRTVARGANVHPLPRSERPLEDLTIVSNGQEYDLADYVSRNRVAGLLILDDGRIAHERYELGNDASTRWISMSMAKSVSTTLVGAAVHDGAIGSLDEPLTRYLPELTGGAYDGVSVRQLLQMTSGAAWDDTHTDPDSERRRMLELQIAQQPGSILRYVAQRPRIAPPGTLWNYSTGETHVVGALLHAATGRWIADYLSEKIWARFGMERDATWWLESPGGLEVAGCGINATLRDYGRFGLFLLQDGIANGERVLPEGWVREATCSQQVGGMRVDYGYMWWPVADADGSFGSGGFSARGIFGQYIYVNPRERVVIVALSARAKPKGAEAIIDNDFFNGVVAALRGASA